MGGWYGREKKGMLRVLVLEFKVTTHYYKKRSPSRKGTVGSGCYSKTRDTETLPNPICQSNPPWNTASESHEKQPLRRFVLRHLRRLSILFQERKDLIQESELLRAALRLKKINGDYG